MMTSREVVRRAIEFKYPERLPFDMFVSGPSDVHHANRGEGNDPRTKASTDRIYVDHFGCEFEVLNEKTMGQPTNFPLEDITKLDKYRFPDPLDEAVLCAIGESLEAAADKYVYSNLIWFTFFERMHFIHGFSQTMMDLYLQKPLMMEFADRVIEYNITAVKGLADRFPGRVHGIAMSDDWGSQNATLISLELFRDFFLPRYKRLFGSIRDLGMHVWFHSCGNVVEFIPAFIEAGVQVLNLQQPRIFDLETLRRRFAGSICFNVPIDIQATMPNGTWDDIRQEASELVAHLSTDSGGLIASEHPDYRGNGIDPIKGQWAYQAFRQADPYAKQALTSKWG